MPLFEVLVSKMFRLSIAFSLLLVALFSSSQSPSPTFLGKWTGRMKVSPAKGPDGKPLPMPPAPSIAYFLTLTNAGTFHTDIKGTPDKKSHTSDGTWTFANGKITLAFQKRDGKPDKTEPRTRVLAISKDGKSMTTIMEGQMQIRGPKGETTLPRGFTPPKVILTFTRN